MLLFNLSDTSLPLHSSQSSGRGPRAAGGSHGPFWSSFAGW